jgi:hypothetical protein
MRYELMAMKGLVTWTYEQPMYGEYMGYLNADKTFEVQLMGGRNNKQMIGSGWELVVTDRNYDIWFHAFGSDKFSIN